ncbi:MAG: FoF1 ATP synthase subunit a [Patescibacteria group bacterium]
MELNISLAPDVLFHLGGLPVTNSLLWSFVVSLFLIIITLIVRGSLRPVPGKLQNIIELLIESGYSFVKSVIGTEKKTKRIFPLIFTMFIFSLVANLAVYIPGQAAITLHKSEGIIPVFRSVMSDYSMVLVMTLIAVILTQIIAIVVHGPFRYLGKFFNFKSPLKFFLGLMDIVAELSKIVSLSFRLFGNIFAGEVLGAVMLSLAPFVIPLPFMFLGLLTAFVQAFVFAVLTLVFVTLASEIDENELVESASI